MAPYSVVLTCQKRGTAQTGITTNTATRFGDPLVLVRKEALPKRALRLFQKAFQCFWFCCVRKEALPKRALRLNVTSCASGARRRGQKRGTAQTGITTPSQTIRQCHFHTVRQKRGTAQTGITTLRYCHCSGQSANLSEKRHCPNGHYDETCAVAVGFAVSVEVRKEALPKRALRPPIALSLA